MNVNLTNIINALQHSDNVTDDDIAAIVSGLQLLHFMSVNPKTAFSYTEIKNALHLINYSHNSQETT